MKDLLKNKFTVDRKSFNEKWEKVGFHLPENPFPLSWMKDSFPKYVSTRRAKTISGINVWKIGKKAIPLARKSLSTNRNAFKNMFAF